jgi:DNA-binding transcriptional ArsR family regulator
MGVDPMSATFDALASPVRRTIPMRLAATDALVGELGKLFDTSLPAISKHLDVLERVGLITRRKDRRFRRVSLDASPISGDEPLKLRCLWQ